MLNENGFNEWASAYDESVRESAQEESYPFAGYGEVLETIFQAASAGPGKKLLDAGFGTAALAHALLLQQGLRFPAWIFPKPCVKSHRGKCRKPA